MAGLQKRFSQGKIPAKLPAFFPGEGVTEPKWKIHLQRKSLENLQVAAEQAAAPTQYRDTEAGIGQGLRRAVAPGPEPACIVKGKPAKDE